MTRIDEKFCVLLIEDEPMVAFYMEDVLTGLGHEVGAVASRISEALEIARTGSFDLALLDVNLAGESSYPVAHFLRERGIPFAFATGYGAQGIDPAFASVPILTKPFLESDMRAVLQRLRKSAALIAQPSASPQ